MVTPLATAGKREPTLRIRPPKKWVPINVSELWHYRELLYSFIARDVKIRYKQTALGFLWAIIQPLFLMVVFTLFFGNLAKVPSDGIPYPLFSFAALLPWTLFAEGLTRSTTSMVSNANIMTKVYFPRLIMPLSGILSPLVDFAIAFVILIIMMAYYGFVPTIAIVLLPHSSSSQFSPRLQSGSGSLHSTSNTVISSIHFRFSSNSGSLHHRLYIRRVWSPSNGNFSML